jgi:argininosuccinate lyase
MKFAPEYVTYVLNENFEDAKELFLSPLMAIHYAHLVMLASQQIVSPEDARSLRVALDTLSQADIRRATYDPSCEDLFYYVERLIVSACGENVADGCTRREPQRHRHDDVGCGSASSSSGFSPPASNCAARCSTRRSPSRNGVRRPHTQRAQPTTVAHYMLAVVEQLERDAPRLEVAFERTNRNPLGACAITGTGFPIDRRLTSDLLGFGGPTGNTYGSIATVDYLLESTAATSVLLAGLGRFVQDLLLWCTSEFSYVRFGDGFVQSSSIMPQKRNPVAIEHARAIGSKALGQAQAVLTTVHNTPFGDIVDTEDDLQPLVFSTFRDATRAVKLVAAGALAPPSSTRAARARGRQRWTTLTELADTSCDHGLLFDGARHHCPLILRGTRSPRTALGASGRGATRAGRAAGYSAALAEI